ncbi:MAG: cytochrome c biogenesis protein CcsA, partial [Flavobacteriales bacterium]
MAYIGEWKLLGDFGDVLVVLAFVSALVSFISYAISGNTEDESWKSIGRKAWMTHVFSVLGIIFVLFLLLLNHRYEFAYVSKHLNNEMPMRYILSCFWEGQEGGFLLWMFWHVVLGTVITRTSGRWEARVMTIFALVQFMLSSMIQGVYFGDFQFGMNPFLLVRELPESIGLPWTYVETYLTDFPQFADGRGLNPLLQNYWMTIHPPTVFLGFAATLVPFSFAAAGLWKKEYHQWMKPALPWAFFGVCILGLGILMG